MKRILMYLVLMFFISLTTTYSYTQVTADNEVYLEDISEFYLINEQLVSGRTSKLVPTGVIRAVGDVYEIVYQYELIIKDGTKLQSKVDDLMFSDSTVSNQQLRDTFNFRFDQTVVESFTYTGDLFEKPVEAQRVLVTLHVTMNAPQTYELYRQIAGGNLNFEVYFYVI